MLNYRAIVLATLQLVLIGTLLVLLALVLGVEKATGPQVMTLSVFLLWPGLYAGLKARDAGILHGIVSGLLGALILSLLLHLFAPLAAGAMLVEQIRGWGLVVVAVMCGFWGGIGGIFADIVRVRRLRKGRK